MKHLQLFENFEDIDTICRRYRITNYTINKDGTVNVDGNVDLGAEPSLLISKRLPLKFGLVRGFFNCSNNQLVTLEGSPKEVGSDFYCMSNKLTTLEGGPNIVGGCFYCRKNDLTSLLGSPKEIGGVFDCYNNPIYQIYNLFGSYKKYQDSLDYNYLRGTNIVKSRFKEALEEIGEELPGWNKSGNKIPGYNYI